MNLVPGDLYFIREVDVLDGTTSPYCKIGLVKDRRQGNAHQRALEHQTGNPRRLHVVDQVHAPAVSDLEASVHNRFASQRILGEWFELPDEHSLAEVIAVTQSLARELTLNLDALEQAERLKSVESTSTVVPPTDKHQSWFLNLHIAKELKKHTGRLRKQAEQVFRAAYDVDTSARRFAEVIERVNKPFATAKFAEAYPDLHDRFLRTESRPTQRFTPKKLDPSVELAADDEFNEFANRFQSLVLITTDNHDQLEELHLSYLRLLGYEAQAAWDAELAEAQLKAECGDARGIDGICTWPRVPSDRLVFDKNALMREHPELHNQFIEQRTDRSFSVLPMRSYRPRG